MTPPAKRIRFSQTPVRRSNRIHRRPDRFEVEGSPRHSSSRTGNVGQSSTPPDAQVCENASLAFASDLQDCTSEAQQCPTEIATATGTEEICDIPSKKRQCSILDLPPDILRMIFSMFTFQQVSRSLRPVCRHLHREAGNFLNSALLALSARLTKSLRALEMQLTCAQDEDEWRAASRAYSALETVYAQYRLVEAVIWRWLSPRHLWDVIGHDAAAASAAASSAGCCYAGRFLDDLYRLAATALTTPENLAMAALSQQAQIDSSVTRFVNYFEKMAGGAAWRRSAQMVDLLDCLLAARYTATQEANESEAAAGICKLRGRYSLPRAWFTSLPLGDPPPVNTTADDARLMVLRIRRLVRSSNKHHLDSIQREREAAALPSFSSASHAAYIPSPATTYSGFGESANHFFYYGSMNERAAKARETADGSETHPQEQLNNRLVEQNVDPDFEPPQPNLQRDAPGADNNSESSAEDLPAEGDDIDDNELALLEADAAREMDDVLAELNLAALDHMHPPDIYNDVDDPLMNAPDLYNDVDDPLPQADEGLHDDVADEYRWLNDDIQFEANQSDAEVAAALDEEINAEAEPMLVPCPVAPLAGPSSALENMAKKELSPENVVVEREELLNGSDLLFDVDLTCPIELAPLAVCRKFEFATLEYEAQKLARKTLKSYKRETKTKASSSRRSRKDRSESERVQEDFGLNESYGFAVPFHLVLTIRCPTSARNRLPPIYVYEVKSPTP